MVVAVCSVCRLRVCAGGEMGMLVPCQPVATCDLETDRQPEEFRCWVGMRYGRDTGRQGRGRGCAAQITESFGSASVPPLPWPGLPFLLANHALAV